MDNVECTANSIVVAEGKWYELAGSGFGKRSSVSNNIDGGIARDWAELVSML